MIESFNVPKPEVAKWAGITSAVFALSQCLTGIAWGRASDRFGRKPIILTSMICTMLASLCFGFSRTLWWAIVSRSFAGASNGNVGIMRTAVAELVPQKELQPRAFSVMPLVGVRLSILERIPVDLGVDMDDWIYLWSGIRWSVGKPCDDSPKMVREQCFS